jgi:prepilin-type N-terminal cleavage/methylation domain-containing protein
MTQLTQQSRRTEGGFTLVELAIVMIIIGLLIGGILKGQELITNARVSSAVAQIKAVESGISGFRDKYGGLPGDIRNVAARLPNATVGFINTDPTIGTGNDGFISNVGPAINPTLAVTDATEGMEAFLHLAASGFLGGINPSAAAIAVGQTNPETPLSGAWTMGSANGAATGTIFINGLPQGVYLASSLNLAVNPANDTQTFTPSQAATIDRKLDDGRPNSGSVRALGNATVAATTCTTVNDSTGLYNELAGVTSCGILARVQ